MKESEKLSFFAGMAFGIFITAMYIGVGVFVWVLNPKLKMMSPEIAPWVSALFIVYGCIRGYRIYQDFGKR
ncbi:MAG: hypothetical protein JNN12_08145 [Bacteroidetes Order II. Incertae sedis bacterium]|nr:hypothetical protein [Bacteroidetes Order II. bacterium]